MRDDLLLSGVYVWIMLQNVRMNQLVLSTKKHQGFVLEGAQPAMRRSLIISRSFPDSFLAQTRFQRAPFIAPTKPRYHPTPDALLLDRFPFGFCLVLLGFGVLVFRFPFAGAYQEESTSTATVRIHDKTRHIALQSISRYCESIPSSGD